MLPIGNLLKGVEGVTIFFLFWLLLALLRSENHIPTQKSEAPLFYEISILLSIFISLRLTIIARAIHSLNILFRI